MKCNQSRPGFELLSPCPFPTMITITPWAPPTLYQSWEKSKGFNILRHQNARETFEVVYCSDIQKAQYYVDYLNSFFANLFNIIQCISLMFCLDAQIKVKSLLHCIWWLIGRCAVSISYVYANEHAWYTNYSKNRPSIWLGSFLSFPFLSFFRISKAVKYDIWLLLITLCFTSFSIISLGVMFVLLNVLSLTKKSMTKSCEPILYKMGWKIDRLMSYLMLMTFH